MKTVDFLQLWLSMPSKAGIASAPTVKPRLILESGEVLSIQAGEAWCSSPRESVGPYTSVEVAPTTWYEGVYGEKAGYDSTDFPVAFFVGIESLAEVIDAHGGVDVIATLEKITRETI